MGSTALRRAQARNVDVARSSATRLPVAHESVDLVVALAVLEHLDDDVAAAREILASLAPGGLLEATVPADPSLWSSHDVALGHRRRYRRRQLRELLESTGFRIERCSYVMWAPLPFAAALRLAERFAPKPAVSGYIRVPRPLNELLTWIVGFDARLVRWGTLPFGLSVLAVARRPSS